MSDDWAAFEAVVACAEQTMRRADLELARQEARSAIHRMVWDAYDRLLDDVRSPGGAADLGELDLVEGEIRLLAELCNSVLADEIALILVAADFRSTATGAAYRLLAGNQWEVVSARNAARDPDVAAVLQHVALRVSYMGDVSRNRLIHPGGPLRRLLVRRYRQVQAERLVDLCESMTGSPGTVWQDWDLAASTIHRVVEGERDILLGQKLPVLPLPRLWPTPRRSLLEDVADDVVLLEDIRVAEVAIELISAADRRVLVVQPWIGGDPLADAFVSACAAAVARGVETVVVTRQVKRTHTPDGWVAERDAKRALVEAGVNVIWHRHVHDKVFVVDDTALVGSTNLTRFDIRINPNSAIGTVAASVVAGLAARIQGFGVPPQMTAPAIADSELPVWAWDADADMAHRLAVPGDTDFGLLETTPSDTTCKQTIQAEACCWFWRLCRGEQCDACHSYEPA